MEEKLREVRALLAEVADLDGIGSVCYWDQRTYMPPGGAEARGRQLSTLARLSHEKRTAPRLGALLGELAPYAASLPYDSDDASLIRVAHRNFDLAVKLPGDYVSRMTNAESAAYEAWHAARPANDFAAVRPHLETMLDLSREFSSFFHGYAHIADPLIDPHNVGMKAADIAALFAELRKGLVPLVQEISAQPPIDDTCLHQQYPEAEQLAFGAEMVKAFGYDFSRGRQDKTAHPFMITFNLGDIRITTRVKEADLSEALFSTIHESGHAMYEQGINRAYDATPLADGASGEVHESQSRLWENIVGRGRACWQYWYPRAQAAFPAQLGTVPQEMFYRAVNKVMPSLIRTDADEVTYNLHVMIRFDLGLQLLEGTLAVKDLPEAWNARYASDLGITPPDDRDGVLQDVHWYSGLIGGSFHIYTLGNLLAAQFYAQALQAHPAIPEEISRGEYGTLRGWLVKHIYRHGAKYTTNELVQRVTDGPLRCTPFLTYLRAKFGELYGR